MATVVGVFAGITGASLVLGWIWPYAGEGDTWATSRIRSTLSSRQLEEHVREETADRIVSVYSRMSNVYGMQKLEQDNRLGEAIIVSTDGWVVMQNPGLATTPLNWLVLNADDKIFTISEFVLDARTDLLYFKLKNNSAADFQFKVANFDQTGLASGDEVYVYQERNWHYGFVKFSNFIWQGESHLDSAPLFSYGLNADFAPGAIVVNPQGRVVGIINKSFDLLPAKNVVRVLPGILSQSKVKYSSLGAEGWFSVESPVFLDGESQTGFVVAKVLSSQSKLRVGDIMVLVNGTPVAPVDFYSQLDGIGEVSLQILRNGKILEISTPVLTL